MSARAAWRLESLGFKRVYRFEPGKEFWGANDLPVEGEAAGFPRVGHAARRDIPTCRLGQSVGDAQRAAADGGLDVCIVLNEQDVVMGRLRGKALHGDPATPVTQAMESGPTSTRPDTLLGEMVPHMQERRAGSILVTDPDGHLLGILYRADGERMLEELHAQRDEHHEA